MFPASSTMVPDVFWVLGHLPTQAAAHAARPCSYGRRPPAPRAARPAAGLPAAFLSVLRAASTAVAHGRLATAAGAGRAGPAAVALRRPCPGAAPSPAGQQAPLPRPCPHVGSPLQATQQSSMDVLYVSNKGRRRPYLRFCHPSVNPRHLIILAPF